jgi:hypothetical protein
MATIDLQVPTVHCTACKLNIEERLEELAKRVALDSTHDAAGSIGGSTSRCPGRHRRSNQPNHHVAAATDMNPTKL